MSTPDQRQGAVTADSNAAASAYAEQQARYDADIAAMQQGPTEHAAGLLDHNQGMPTVETQMQTHGQPAPATPDHGGHG